MFRKMVEEWAADEGIDVIYKGPTDTDAAANERRRIVGEMSGDNITEAGILDIIR